MTSRLKNTGACYKASTMTQIQHKNSINTQNQNTKQIKQKQNCRKSNIKEVLGQKPYILKNIDKLI
jgi:hypothetical protein